MKHGNWCVLCPLGFSALLVLNLLYILILILHNLPIPMVVVEGIWTIVAGVATFIHLWALRDAMIDLSVVTASPDWHAEDPRYIVAFGNVRRESNRLYIQGLFLLAGVASLISRAGTPSRLSNTQNPLVTVIIASLIMAAITFAIMSLLDRLDRQRVLDAVRGRRVGD